MLSLAHTRTHSPSLLSLPGNQNVLLKQSAAETFGEFKVHLGSRTCIRASHRAEKLHTGILTRGESRGHHWADGKHSTESTGLGHNRHFPSPYQHLPHICSLLSILHVSAFLSFFYSRIYFLTFFCFAGICSVSVTQSIFTFHTNPIPTTATRRPSRKDDTTIIDSFTILATFDHLLFCTLYERYALLRQR